MARFWDAVHRGACAEAARRLSPWELSKERRIALPCSRCCSAAPCTARFLGRSATAISGGDRTSCQRVHTVSSRLCRVWSTSREARLGCVSMRRTSGDTDCPDSALAARTYGGDSAAALTLAYYPLSFPFLRRFPSSSFPHLSCGPCPLRSFSCRVLVSRYVLPVREPVLTCHVPGDPTTRASTSTPIRGYRSSTR